MMRVVNNKSFVVVNAGLMTVVQTDPWCIRTKVVDAQGEHFVTLSWHEVLVLAEEYMKTANKTEHWPSIQVERAKSDREG